MSDQEDKASKTEEATEKKIHDAIEKGNTPYSKEVAALTSLSGIIAVTLLVLPGGVSSLGSQLRYFIDNSGGLQLESSGDAQHIFYMIGAGLLALFLPAVGILAVAGLASSFLQNPPRLVLHRIKPKRSNISLKKGVTRIFGTQGQIEFLKSLFKLSIAGAVGFFSIKTAQTELLNSMFIDPSEILGLTRGIALRVLNWMVLALILLVAADLMWSRHFWRRELRMSHKDIKDEMKQADGDPHVKARRLSVARDRARRRMIAAVPRATLVIANPTHFAVALRYVQEESAAPLVVAKGKDLIALKIREVAEENDIPVIEDKALAKSLYKAVEVDGMIPPEFYKAVANLIFLLSSGRNEQGNRGQ